MLLVMGIFTGMEVFVIGAGFAAAEEAIFLTKYATKVTIIAREPEFTCAKSIAEKVLSHPKIEIKFNTELLEAKGDIQLRSAVFKNNITGEISEYKAQMENLLEYLSSLVMSLKVNFSKNI